MKTSFKSKYYQGSRGASEAAFFTEEQVGLCFLNESLRQWKDEQRADAADVLTDDDCCKFLDSLSSIFQFLGGCLEQRSAAMRTWVVLREFAPHFVSDETMTDAAKRFGVTLLVLQRLRADLLVSLPALAGKRTRMVAFTEKERERHRYQERERQKFLKKEKARLANESAALASVEEVSAG